ncbi:MAG TPA: hypothetical protein VFV76_04700 [Actinomycetes bacterium]|nr:hypothetical protein [Actinomycetes bacterium]
MDEPRLLPVGPLRTRAALRHVTRRELAGPLWQRLHRGVHAQSALDPTDPDVRIAAAVELLPDGAAVTGWAGLRLLGATDLDGRYGLAARRLLPVEVSVGRSGLIRPQPGVRLDRTPLRASDVVVVDGVPVTSPLRSCEYLATHHPVERSTAYADVAVRVGLADLVPLRRRLGSMTRRHGAPRARIAATLVDGRSASVPESVLKVVWVVAAGLPHPLVNRAVVDDRGWPLGVPDLLDPESALVGEYDGSTHRELDSHAWDNQREEGFEDHNLVVVRATSLDLWPRRELLVRRLRAGHRRGLARDRSRDRWALRALAA